MLQKMPLPALMSVLLMLAQPALALDIDRIEVRSQLDQPLLAQIPVISERPAELDLSAGAVACSVRLVSGGSG